MSIDRGMDKEDVVHKYTMEYYSAIKKEWNNAFCSNMDGPRDDHTKWSKSDREKQIPYDITYMWNLKKDTNEFITKHKQTHRLQKQAYGYQKGNMGEGIN